MGSDPHYHLEQLQSQMDDHERGARGVERQLDQEIERGNKLYKESHELALEILSLRGQLSDIRRQIAEKIRAELVCCYIYDDDRGTSRAGRTHAICFWGEAAARIAEGREDLDPGDVVRDPGLPWEILNEPYVAGPGETVPSGFTGSAPLFPGQIGYRAGEHNRPQAPCFECVTSDEDPRPWCDCRDDEVCKGPCRRKAHDWSFHKQGCTHHIRVSAARADETCCPYCGVPVSREGS